MNTKQALQPVSQVLLALAEPVRLRMLRLLELEELSVGEVAKVVQLPQSTVSRHLKTLSEVRLIAKRAVGTATLYRLLLDDLSPEFRALWIAVRDQLHREDDHDDDIRRLKLIITERKIDSKDFFGRVAGDWNEIRHSLFGEGFTAPALLAMVNPKWTVADLGCGSGDVTRLLMPHVARVIAIDQSEAMLDAARARLDDSESVDFVSCDLENLSLADRSVDIAVLSLVVHHIDDPSRVIKEAYRILRVGNGGGVLLMIDMLAHDREEYRRTMGHRHLGFTRDEISEHMDRAGFGSTRIHELPTSTDSRGPGLFVASARIN
ncbi:MAG: ArsR family transcriptional regulator [Phycisphaera sp.]|nr:MAG: ArsR family transcriptional regulator [Phycisphaera sp.]